MTGDWQDVVALLAVLVAGAYVARRFLPWPLRKAGAAPGGCDSGCGGCPLSRGGAAAGSDPVQIGGLPRPR